MDFEPEIERSAWEQLLPGCCIFVAVANHGNRKKVTVHFGCGAKSPIRQVVNISDNAYFTCDSDPSADVSFRTLVEIPPEQKFDIVTSNHVFEHLPFERAVVEGANTFGCHPFLPEEQFRELLQRGRIRPEDIEATLIDDLGDRADVLLGFLGTRFHLRQAMLRHPLHVGPTAELKWVIAETDALRRFREETPQRIRDDLVNQTRHWIMRDLRNGEPDGGDDGDQSKSRAILQNLYALFDKSDIEQWSDDTWEAFCLHLLWLMCFDGAGRVNGDRSPRPTDVRHRDLLLEATGEDSDALVHDVLIRFCGAFLDQGCASWSLAGR